MSKITKVISSLATLAIVGIIFASCSSTTSPTGSASSNVSVTAATINSVTVSWTRDASDASGIDTVVVKTAGGTVAGTAVVVSPGTSGMVSGLTVNTPYTITVNSANGASSAINYTIPAPPTAMMVLSVSSSSIGAEWTRGAGDNGTDTIVATSSGSGGAVAATALSTGSSGVVTGLADGALYIISIHNATGTSNSITWAPADRTPNIQIYESADPSSSDPSALILGSNSAAQSLSGPQTPDFVLQTITDGSVASGISLVAGIVHNSNWNDTKVDGSASDHSDYVPGGLNADYSSVNYQADQVASSDNSYDIPNDAIYGTKGSRVLITTTAPPNGNPGNLALVEIVPDVTGKLWSYAADGVHKYITVNISYQNTPNEPYAARGRWPHSSGPVTRISAK